MSTATANVDESVEIYHNIPIANLYYLLIYGFRLAVKRTDAASIVNDFKTPHDLLAWFLCTFVDSQIKRGLNKEYLQTSESLPTLRGKLALPQTVQLKVRGRQQLHCEYEVLTANNLFNQIIKTALHILLHHGRLENKQSMAVRKVIRYFGTVDLVPNGAIPWQQLHFHRNNSSYRSIITICRIILDDLLVSTSRAETRLKLFLSDDKMSKLFEDFVRNYYKYHYPHLKPGSRHIHWKSSGTTGSNLLPIMKTDTTLESDCHMLIIETKYYQAMYAYQYGDMSLRREHLSQLYSYVSQASCDPGKKRSGVLLYAQTLNEAPLNLRDTIGGFDIRAMSLDLSKPFTDICEQLDSIAESTEQTPS